MKICVLKLLCGWEKCIQKGRRKHDCEVFCQWVDDLPSHNLSPERAPRIATCWCITLDFALWVTKRSLCGGALTLQQCCVKTCELFCLMAWRFLNRENAGGTLFKCKGHHVMFVPKLHCEIEPNRMGLGQGKVYTRRRTRIVHLCVYAQLSILVRTLSRVI